jgi:hypothetical protein
VQQAEAMIVCALDLATATGVCDGPVGGRARCWSWYLKDGGDTRPERLLQLAKFLRAYFQKCPCDGVVYEAPMPIGVIAGKPGKRGFIMSEDNVAFARGAVGVLEMTCCEFSKPIDSIRVMDARATTLGWRTNKTGEETKARVMREVTKVHGVDVESDNEADAWVLWMAACMRADPKLALEQAPLFGGALRS